jgi:hypothetical protein
MNFYPILSLFNQSSPSHPYSVRPILILYSDLLLGRPRHIPVEVLHIKLCDNVSKPEIKINSKLNILWKFEVKHPLEIQS